MLLQQTIDPAPAAKLAAMVEQYLQSGGRIERLPGPSLEPPPVRREPRRRSKPKAKRRDLSVSSVKRYREHGSQVIAMFEQGLPYKHIAREIGRSDAFVMRCLDWYGIDAQAVRAEQQLLEVAETLEQIRLLMRDGHSGRYIAEQLGVSPSRVRWLQEKYREKLKPGSKVRLRRK